MNRFIHVACRLLGVRLALVPLVVLSSRSKRTVALPLPQPVNAIDGPATEAMQASAVPTRAMTLPCQPIKASHTEALARRFWRPLEPFTSYARSIAMLALHRLQRTTYGQAVEAEVPEYFFVHRDIKNGGTFKLLESPFKYCGCATLLRQPRLMPI